MFVRILVMFSFMIAELGFGIMGYLKVVADHPYGVNEEGAAMCVLITVFILVSWMLTIAVVVRRSSRDNANWIVTEATSRAARILGEATEKSLALSSLDKGRCRNCDNPRTGKFCPKCGTPAQSAV